MAEYIERKKFIRKLNYICKTYGFSKVVIEKFKNAIDDSIATDVVEVEVAKNALEKQIPKKVRIDSEEWYCCPNCDETFSLTNAFHKRNKYCGYCGQALDWSDKNG